jgi:hypothetical protein
MLKWNSSEVFKIWNKCHSEGIKLWKYDAPGASRSQIRAVKALLGAMVIRNFEGRQA